MRNVDNEHSLSYLRVNRGNPPQMETPMPRTTKDATRRKLRDAVVAEAVDKGFAAASVAGVVRRARVSAGTVYVHFDSKDDMLRSVYMDLKQEFHTALTAADMADSAAMIRGMWMGMFEFVATRPRDFLFLEYGASAGVLTAGDQQVIAGYAAEISDLLQRGVDDGTLAPLDSGMLSLLLVAPAMQLARSSVLTGTEVTCQTVTTMFDRVWLSIAA
ncbi:TetR/AcrR family transcriptional regulator [Pseudooceanicola aestuarii]|uniref:TetR/AcrR family transcriptional regulator n=1 Tax=Pseudooceanicola aestuarii TaxID=2697319 RepID=UPI001EF75F5E|nr:TetR/AcrR family transcriptional regulator [Pseudooceanicola aestuarii]